jgi:hypothetical protein
MLYVNHDKKAIFIHIPKTGGSYIGPTLVQYYGFTSYLELLNKRRPDHDEICQINKFPIVLTGNKLYDNSFFNKFIGLLVYCKTSDYINQICGLDKDKWNTYTKFCFIRHPYDRSISGWNHLKKLFPNILPFHNYMMQNQYKVSDIEYGHIFMSQKKHIQDVNGECGVNIIGRFEHLEDDFIKILMNIGFAIKDIKHIPKKMNVSRTGDTETIIMSLNTISLLDDIFDEDFDAFHYTKRVPL